MSSPSYLYSGATDDSSTSKQMEPLLEEIVLLFHVGRLSNIVILSTFGLVQHKANEVESVTWRDEFSGRKKVISPGSPPHPEGFMRRRLSNLTSKGSLILSPTVSVSLLEVGEAQCQYISTS